jgi:hypothetical protein
LPLFELQEGELAPFRRLQGGAELYEKEIEALLWENVEEFTGDTLFPVTRQARLSAGGIPDVVALDRGGRVVVFEVKRDIDRRQLAQCLEYAGWARTTDLDELAGMYYRGPQHFWADWQEFTESDTTVLVNPHPKLILVARDFQQRTESAFDFLIENGLPVKLVRVTVYEDQNGRRLIDVEGEHEPDLKPVSEEHQWPDHTHIDGRAIKIPDLLEYGLVEVGEPLTWSRPKKGTSYQASVTDNGAIQHTDGRSFSSPSRAAMEAADVASYDGWYAWKVDRLGKTLNDLRYDLKELQTRIPEANMNE